MTFRLTNPPAMFMHIINVMFWDLLDPFMVIYLDGILVYSSLPRNIGRMSELYCNACEKTISKCEKCQFAQIMVDFLGHWISLAGITIEPEKTETLPCCQLLRQMKDDQWLLRFSNYYQTFIP